MDQAAHGAAIAAVMVGVSGCWWWPSTQPALPAHVPADAPERIAPPRHCRHGRDTALVMIDAGRVQSKRSGRTHPGLAPEEVLLGQNVSILMPEPDRSRHDTKDQRYLDGQGGGLIGARSRRWPCGPMAARCPSACRWAGCRWMAIPVRGLHQ